MTSRAAAAKGSVPAKGHGNTPIAPAEEETIIFASAGGGALNPLAPRVDIDIAPSGSRIVGGAGGRGGGVVERSLDSC